MSLPDRNQQLQHLADQFASIHKAILTKYSVPPAPMTPVLCKVLLLIGSEPDINIKRIASWLMISSGAATQHVDALEGDGCVTRSASTHDRREIMVTLTPRGTQLYQELRTMSLKILEDVFQGLHDDELQQLIQLMTKVHNSRWHEQEQT